MNHTLLRHFSLGVLTVLTLVSVSSCGRRTAGAVNRTAMVSVEPLRDIVSAVAGPGWQIGTVVEAGADPENFDPPVSVLSRIAKADALFTTGFLPFEQTVITRIGTTGPQVSTISHGIELIEGSHGDEHGVDPHIWTSLRNAQIMAQNTCKALSELDPAHADDYSRRADSLTAVYSRADLRIDSMLRRTTDRAFLIRHPALTYFARDYLLEQIAVGADNKELSIGAVRRAIEDAGAAGAAVYFVESESERDRAQTIAAELGIPAVIFNPMDADIIRQLTDIAEAVSAERARPLSTSSGHLFSRPQ